MPLTTYHTPNTITALIVTYTLYLFVNLITPNYLCFPTVLMRRVDERCGTRLGDEEHLLDRRTLQSHWCPSNSRVSSHMESDR